MDPRPETIRADASHPLPHRRALLAAAGLAGASAGELARTHILAVRLPDGSLEQIRYLGDSLGDRPLKISFGQAPLVAPGFEAVGPDWPFAALDRISAEMDREAQALLNETARLQRSALFPGARGLADSGWLAPGARSVSVVSTLSGGHMCSRSVEVFPSPDGGRPRFVTRTSGDCGPGHPGSPSLGPRRPAEPARTRPGLIEVNLTPGHIHAPEAASDRIAVR
jgi:hypothetical protein